jgi:GDP-L-fucose synthase
MNKIVFGATGLLGSALLRLYPDAMSVSSKDVDLTNSEKTNLWFNKNRKCIYESTIFICCGKVAGIIGQNNYEMLLNNIKMGVNIIENIKKFQKFGNSIYFSSSCVYPENLNNYKENDIFNGKFQPTNEGYSIAKSTCQMLCSYFNLEVGRRQFINIIPPNLWGENDNWDINKSHLLTGVTKKIYEGKKKKENYVLLLGNSQTRREFLRSDDVALATKFILDKDIDEDTFNVGYGKDFSIGWLANEISNKIGYEGKIKYSGTNVGQKQKLMNSDLIFNLGWKPLYDYHDMVDFVLTEIQINAS